MTHINDDHLEINLVAHLLNLIHVAPVSPPQYNYDDPQANVINELTPSTSTGATALAPLFSFTAWGIIHLRFRNMILYGFIWLYMDLWYITYNTFYTLLE